MEDIREKIPIIIAFFVAIIIGGLPEKIKVNYPE